MVFRKQLNPEGDYLDKEGTRYEILSCNRAETMEYVQTGTDTQIIDGEAVEVPVMEQRIVINKNWDAYASLEAAAEAYGLIYQPLTEEEKLNLTNEVPQ